MAKWSSYFSLVEEVNTHEEHVFPNMEFAYLAGSNSLFETRIVISSKRYYYKTLAEAERSYQHLIDSHLKNDWKVGLVLKHDTPNSKKIRLDKSKDYIWIRIEEMRGLTRLINKEKFNKGLPRARKI